VDNKHNIDQLFKRAVDNYELKPSADLWGRIEEELDTQEPTHTKLPLMRYAALLLVFISVCLLSVPLSKQNPLYTNPTAINPNTPIEANVAMDILTVATDQTAAIIPIQVDIAKITTLKDGVTELEQSNTLNPFAATAIAFVGKSDDLLLLPETSKDIMISASKNSIIDRIYNTDKSINVLGFNAFEAEVNNSENDAILDAPSNTITYRSLDKSGLYIGTSGSYNQTSILEYGNVFKGGRPIQPSLKFGTAKGLLMGYNFSNKFGIEAEYIYNAVLGQNYVMSEDEAIVEKSLSLTYDLIPVVAKLKVGKLSDLTNQPVVMNYVAGVQYGILKEARLPQDKRYDASAEELFKDTDLSVVLGLEYEIYLQENIMFSIGARGTFSNDISTHETPFNDYAKRNFTFGLRGSVSYLLH